MARAARGIYRRQGAVFVLFNFTDITAEINMKFRTECVTLASVVIAACLVLPGAAAAKDYDPRSVYPNPEPEAAANWKRLGPCADPWVTMALQVVHGTADRAKCAKALYNGGRWSNFNELVHAVGRRQATISGRASTFKLDN